MRNLERGRRAAGLGAAACLFALAAAGCPGNGATDGTVPGDAAPGTDAVTPPPDAASSDATADGAAATDAGACPAAPEPAAPGPAGCTASWVVDDAWLDASLATVRPVDLRDAAAYDAGHVPGAVRIDLSSLLTTVGGVPNEVVPPATAGAVLSAAGLLPSDLVVAYDGNDGMNASRFAWTLRYYGHPDVRVLDGGWGGWSAGGFAAETAPWSGAATTYTPAPALAELYADADWVLTRLGDPSVVIVDARSAAEYAAGHIPGALNYNWTGNLSSGFFRPAGELLALYGAIPLDAQVVTYCATGMRASVDWFVLRWLGWPDVRVYDGSWAEWGSDPMYPVEM